MEYYRVKTKGYFRRYKYYPNIKYQQESFRDLIKKTHLKNSHIEKVRNETPNPKLDIRR